MQLSFIKLNKGTSTCMQRQHRVYIAISFKKTLEFTTKNRSNLLAPLNTCFTFFWPNILQLFLSCLCFIVSSFLFYYYHNKHDRTVPKLWHAHVVLISVLQCLIKIFLLTDWHSLTLFCKVKMYRMWLVNLNAHVYLVKEGPVKKNMI